MKELSSGSSQSRRMHQYDVYMGAIPVRFLVQMGMMVVTVGIERQNVNRVGVKLTAKRFYYNRWREGLSFRDGQGIEYDNLEGTEPNRVIHEG